MWQRRPPFPPHWAFGMYFIPMSRGFCPPLACPPLYLLQPTHPPKHAQPPPLTSRLCTFAESLQLVPTVLFLKLWSPCTAAHVPLERHPLDRPPTATPLRPPGARPRGSPCRWSTLNGPSSLTTTWASGAAAPCTSRPTTGSTWSRLSRTTHATWWRRGNPASSKSQQKSTVRAPHTPLPPPPLSDKPSRIQARPWPARPIRVP